MALDSHDLFWQLINTFRATDPSVHEGTIMGGRCARVDGQFLALVDYKGSGLVVKLPRPRVDQLIRDGVGQAFAPAGRTFSEWVAVPQPDRRLWSQLLAEGIAFVADTGGSSAHRGGRDPD